jgi:hypothetical protein
MLPRLRELSSSLLATCTDERHELDGGIPGSDGSGIAYVIERVSGVGQLRQAEHGRRTTCRASTDGQDVWTVTSGVMALAWYRRRGRK